jgi:hypothetical protein
MNLIFKTSCDDRVVRVIVDLLADQRLLRQPRCPLKKNWVFVEI